MDLTNALNSIDTKPVKLWDAEEAKQFYQRLSFSSLNDFHTCPRMWQLSRFKMQRETTIHTAFGHCVGEAVANIAGGMELDDAIFAAFAGWELDFFEEQTKSKKSFAMAVDAIKSFHMLWELSLSDQWEVLLVDGKPAAELGLRVLVGGYAYRGFVDLVLKNKYTGEIAILECKTTGAKEAVEAMYGNSNQSLGYAVFLDKIVPEVSSYQVLHLVYSTSAREWHVFPVHKTILRRANWLRDLVYEVRTLEMYQEDDAFPMRGSGCVSYGRTCYWYGICDNDTSELIPVMPVLEPEDDSKYHYTFTLDELIAQQLENSV
jgi:hypothetical protein